MIVGVQHTITRCHARRLVNERQDATSHYMDELSSDFAEFFVGSNLEEFDSAKNVSFSPTTPQRWTQVKISAQELATGL